MAILKQDTIQMPCPHQRHGSCLTILSANVWPGEMVPESMDDDTAPFSAESRLSESISTRAKQAALLNSL